MTLLDQMYSPVLKSTEASERLIASTDGLVFLARENSRLQGFAAFQCVLDEASLLNLVVAPDYRQAGVARKLLGHGITALRQRGTQRLLLELRESNRAAFNLYRSFEFIEDGKRSAYYPPLTSVDSNQSSVREDGVLMSLILENVNASA